MTTLNFPNNPTDGQEYEGYIYNATKGVWDSGGTSGLVLNLNEIADVDTTGVEEGNALVYDALLEEWVPGEGGGGASYTVSETAPEYPNPGDVWFNSTNGRSYLYYEDYDSFQWVEVSGIEGAEGIIGNLNDIGDVDTVGVVDGQALVYSSDLGAWIPGEAGGKFVVSDTAPENAENGDTWFSSDKGKTYIYYEDYDNGQWVEIASTVVGYLDLSQLNDVTIVSPTSGQALTYDGTGWVNSTPASTIDSLTDTSINTPLSDDALLYDGTNWVNEKVQKAKLETLNSDTIAVDFSDTTQLIYREVAENVSLSGSNYTAGVRKQINFLGDSVERSISYPSEWNFVSEKPITVSPNRNSILDLSSYGSTASSTVAIWIPGVFHPTIASGGTVSTATIDGVTYQIHSFTAVGTSSFVVDQVGDVDEVEYLVIGGGGGGGGDGYTTAGGGGGAGGYRSNVPGEPSGQGSSAESPFFVSEGSYAVTVGVGGTRSTSQANNGTDGGNSIFDSITATGGGRGGWSQGVSGQPGGSGGGGNFSGGGGTGITNQGNGGGAGRGMPVSPPHPGGGGGGATQSGTNGVGTTGGKGGNGLASSITGSSVTRAGGGGGGGGTGGAGGSGGGGAAGVSAGNNGNPGVANTGGGGGGASISGSTSSGARRDGANGGSGIVIIRYPITDPN